LRHVKADRICPFYMAGFCPYGDKCDNGAHARFPTNLKKPVIKGQEPPKEEEVKDTPMLDPKMDDEPGHDRFSSAGQHKFGGRGNWQGKKKRGGGGGGFRGRRN